MQVLKITGVLQNGKPTTIWAVIVAAGRYINDYTGSSPRRPNAKWMVDTSMGPNHGSVYLVACTQNGCGVGPKVEVCTSYGQYHNFSDQSVLAPRTI